MRKQFALTCEAVADVDPKLVVMVGDISVHVLRHFKEKYPDRFFNIGILEQAMVSMAAGLAEQGLFPVIHTISPFLVERAYEQIKNDCCYQKLGVNLVTVGAAFDYIPDGPTHHNLADFAILRVLPEMQLVCPGSAMEFDCLFRQAYNNGHPTYFRLSSAVSGINFNKEKIKFGQGIHVKEGKRLLVIVLGPQLGNVVAAAEGRDIDIIYIHTMKPFDTQLVRERARHVPNILCVEEHSQHGGLAAVVAEAVSDLPGVQIGRVGIPDAFQDAYGTYKEAVAAIGLDIAGIGHAMDRATRPS